MKGWKSVLLVLGVTLGTTSAWAADEPRVWHVDVTPYVWAAGLYGDVTVRGVSVPVSVSFPDILENSDSLIGLQGRVEVSREPWGAFVDGTYAKIKVDDLGPARIDLTDRMAVVDFGVRYRLVDTAGHPAPGAATPGVALDVYGGGRYMYLDLDLDPQGAGSVRQSLDWVDPIVGLRVIPSLTEHFFLVVGGDIGGFGVSSDLTWSALGLLGYRFPLFGLDAAVLAGYRALGDDYATGSGVQELRFDTTLHGPVLGLSVRF